MDDSSTSTKIPLLQRIFLFSNQRRSVRRLLELSSVTSSWADCVQNYPVWREALLEPVKQKAAAAAANQNDADDANGGVGSGSPSSSSFSPTASPVASALLVGNSQQPSTMMVVNLTKLKNLFARAAACGSVWILASLVNMRIDGLDCRSFSNFYGSPLLLAVSGNHIACVQFLLENEENPASLFQTDVAERSVLHLARTPEMARLLLHYNNGLRRRPNDGHTTAEKSTKSSSSTCSSREGTDLVLALDYSGLSPLYTAAERGDVEVVRLLLHAMDQVGMDAMPFPEQLAGRPPAQWTQQQIKEIYLDDSYGTAPFYAACARGKLETVQLIWAASKQHFMKQRCADIAAQNAHLEILQFIDRVGGPTLSAVPGYYPNSAPVHWCMLSVESCFKNCGRLPSGKSDPCLTFLWRAIQANKSIVVPERMREYMKQLEECQEESLLQQRQQPTPVKCVKMKVN